MNWSYIQVSWLTNQGISSIKTRYMTNYIYTKSLVLLVMSFFFFSYAHHVKATSSVDAYSSIGCPNFGFDVTFDECTATICITAKRLSSSNNYYSIEVSDSNGNMIGSSPSSQDNCFSIDLPPGETFTVSGIVYHTASSGPFGTTNKPPTTFICPLDELEIESPDDCGSMEPPCSVGQIICGDTFEGPDGEFDIMWTTEGDVCGLTLRYLNYLEGENCCLDPNTGSGIATIPAGQNGFNLEDSSKLRNATCFYFRLEYCCDNPALNESGTETQNRSSCECTDPITTEWMCYKDRECISTLIGGNPGEGENTSSSDFQLYPNPAGDEISVINTSKVTTYITIIDAQGRPMLKDLKMNGSSEEISIEHLSTGLYWVMYRDETGKMLDIEKLIKK